MSRETHGCTPFRLKGKDTGDKAESDALNMFHFKGSEGLEGEEGVAERRISQSGMAPSARTATLTQLALIPANRWPATYARLDHSM